MPIYQTTIKEHTLNPAQGTRKEQPLNYKSELSDKYGNNRQEDDGKKGRFIIYDNNEEAGEMTYVWAGKEKFIIEHTGVEEKFSGQGFAKQLVMAGVDYARKNHLKIIPLCPYAKSRFDRDETIRDVLA